MEIIIGQEFKLPENIADLSDEPLVVHKRHEESHNRNLIIFVHGLGGERYVTWKNFPKFIFEDLIDVDVGLYNYRTLWHRIKFTASIDLDKEAIVLADIIRDARHYEKLILIGHSMGGLLCKAAIKDLIDRNDEVALKRISGLFLIAVPQAGSLWVPSFLAPLIKDFGALEPHGNLVTGITKTFTDRVSAEATSDATNKFVIPIWAVMSVEDYWVDMLSAGLNISTSRQKRVRGSHRKIAKPKSRSDDTYAWIVIRIKEHLDIDKRDTVNPYVEFKIPNTFSPPVYTDIIKRDSELDRLRNAVMEVYIVIVEGVAGSGKCNLVSSFAQKDGKSLYNAIIWYTPNQNDELHNFLYELRENNIGFSGHSDYSSVKDFLYFLNEYNILLVIDNFHIVNYNSYLPLIDFSRNRPGPAHIIFISDCRCYSDYYTLRAIEIEGYADNEARQLLAKHNLKLTNQQFSKLKLQTSLLPFALDLFINLCSSYPYSPDDLLKLHLQPHDKINAWVSCILNSFTEQEIFALQVLSLNDGPFDVSLINWIVGRHLKGLDGQTLLLAIAKPFLLKQIADGKYVIVDILVQYYKEVINLSIKNLIYELLAEYYFHLYEHKLRAPQSLTPLELSCLIKACGFYQACGLFHKSNLILRNINLALKLTGQHSQLIKLSEYEIKYNSKRNSWIDLNYAQACLALGHGKDAFTILRPLVEKILFHEHGKDINKQLAFIRTFCEVLNFVGLHEIALNILTNALKVIEISKAKWNVYLHAVSIITYLYIKNNDNDKAIDMNLGLIDENLFTGHKHAIAIAQTRIGIAYNRKSMWNEAINYLLKAADVFREYDRRAYSWAKLHLSYAYYELGEKFEAEKNLSEALDLQIEHNFIDDEYFNLLNYFSKIVESSDIIERVIKEQARLACIEGQRTIDPVDIQFAQEIEAIYLTEANRGQGTKSLAIVGNNAKMRSRIIKSYVNAASKNPENVPRLLFEKYDPNYIFSIPLFNKFITSPCKLNSHLIYKYIKPNIEIIKTKSNSIKFHFARFMEYKGMVNDALDILESVTAKQDFNYYNIKANCMAHTNFTESMRYNQEALKATYNYNQMARIYNNMANLIYKYHIIGQYHEAIEYCEKAIKYKYSARFNYPLELLVKLKVEVTSISHLKEMILTIMEEHGLAKEVICNLLVGIRNRDKLMIIKRVFNCE